MKTTCRVLFLILLAVVATAAPNRRMIDRDLIGTNPGTVQELLGQDGSARTPRPIENPLDLEAEVWVDDSWTGQGDVDVFNPALIWNTNAFDKIQEGIDAVGLSGIVNVLPGTYLETATGRYVMAPSGQGPHQFGLFIDWFHNGMTLRGVDESGTPITSLAGVAALVQLHATNTFGYSGLFLEADDVVITGLSFEQVINYNKTIEVIGDNLTFKWNKIVDGLSLYFNDWRFDVGLNTSYVQSYLIEGNLFDYGTSVDIASGAGFSGPVSGRQIINNTFDMDWPGEDDYWAAISFNGANSGVPWFVQEVGAAEITGNSFANAEGFYIRHRGDFANPGDFDWVSYWDDNTFDKRVAFGPNPPTVMGTYDYPNSYGTFNDCKEIGANIQREIDWAAGGDMVLCGAGRYTEILHINKHVDLIGAGSGASDLTNTVIEQSGLNNVVFLEASGASNADPILFKDLRVEPLSRYAFETQNLLNLSYLKFDNVKVVGGPATIENLIGLRTASDASLHHVVIDNCEFTNLDYGFYFAKHGDWGPGGSNVTNVTVSNTSISGNYYKGIYAEKLSDASFTNCTFSNNGSAPLWNDAWNGGVDINLKGPEGYQNISFDNCDFTNNGLGFKEGAGLMVKARDDGATYGVHPATLDNVSITNCTFTGNERGLRFGEPTKNNLTPTNAVVTHNEFCDNVKTYGGVDGSAYGDLINWTQAAIDAQQNYWCSSYLCDFAENIVNGSTGSVDYSPWCSDNLYTNCTLALTVAYVDDDWAGSSYGDIVDGHVFGCDAFDNLQDAVDAVSGSDIYLAAGSYAGQTVILNHVGTLNIWGAGKASTFLTAVPSMTHMLPVGSRKPILSIEGSTVNLHDLTIDGDGLGNTNNSFVGIAFWNSSGSMDDCDVLDVRETPFSGAQHGVGVYVSKLSGDPARAVDLSNMTISGFQKNGAAFNGAGITVNCDNVTVVGAGATGVTAQNGLQYYASSGTVTNCSASNIAYSGAGYVACSILLFTAETVNIDNTDALNTQIGVYGYDTDGSYTNGTITATAASLIEPANGIYFYSTTAALRNDGRVASVDLDGPIPDDRSQSLDANEIFDIDNAEIIGAGVVNTYGVAAYVVSDNLDLSLTNSTVRNWYYGVDLTADGGTISPAVVTDNAFMNLNNTYDNTAAHTWDNNCYSDYASNPGYPFTQYNVEGPGANVDANPNPNPEDCNGGAYVLTSDYIGCELACIGDTLYLTFDQAGYVAAQIFVQLPALLDANWAPGTAYNSTFPGSNVATNLSTSAGRRSAGNQIEVNVSWEPPYSDGNGSKYIACIPIKNNGAVGGETLTISTGATTFYYNDGNTTSFDLGSISLYVDCMDPATSIAYTVAPTCNGYKLETDIDGLFTIGVLRGLFPPNAQLASAYVQVNLPAQQIPLFNSLLPGDYTNASFPSPAEATTIWGWLNEGCNSLVVHAFDAECNEGTATINLTKDTDAPDLTITNTSSFCYNNEPTSPQYGGVYLDDYLDITTVLNSNSLLPGCYAQSGTMEISYLAGTPYPAIPLDVTAYPIAGDVLALWNWIVSQVPGADGEDYTFDVEVCDCAGNCYASDFTICIDLVAPDNTFTLFNARPTDLGVWLQWSWTYVAGQAVKAEVWRSPDSGEYPEYAVDMWSDLTNGTYYPVSYPPAGFTLVATQIGTTTSGTYAGPNGQGPAIYGGPGSAYWQDIDASWVDESEDRDIYRYVTFIQDAGGNWSSVGLGYSLNTNADRATNYWLGDYSRETTTSPHGSDGEVTFHDRSLLSIVYFTSTVAGGGSSPNFYDIGPENAENGVGKGEPNPDGLINFSDLVPFSFNFGTVNAGSFSVPNLPPVVFSNLDELPSLSAVISTDKVESSDSPVYVDVALAGNDLDALKVFEVQLGFDSEVLEFVGVTTGDLTVLNGEAWTHSHCVENLDAVVIAGAALGESAVISGDQPVARAEFRWTSETVGNTNITLGHIRLADASGVEMPGPDVTLTLNNTSVIPLSYSLSQNYPNPFNPATTIRFTLPETNIVKLSVYNVLGQSVRTLVNQSMEAGVHEVLWDGRDNSGQSAVSGVYIYRIQAGDFTSSHKMMLTR